MAEDGLQSCFAGAHGHGYVAAVSLVLDVAPLLLSAVLQPKDGGGGVGRNMLAVGDANHLAVSQDVNLFCVVGVTVGAKVEAALNAVVRVFLASFQGFGKRAVHSLPSVDGPDRHL